MGHKPATAPNEANLEAAEESASSSSNINKHEHSRRRSFFSRAHIHGAVDTKHADLLLLAQSVSTGMVDAASFANWAVFCGMQTGNTVILGLSVSTTSAPNNPNPHAWLTTLVSLGSYLLGALFTFRLTFYLAPSIKTAASNRLYLTSLLLAQSLLVLIPAAILVVPDIVPNNEAGVPFSPVDSSHHILYSMRIAALLPPLAFGAGMQIATSRLLGFNELPINVITSTFADIMGDPKVLETHNVKRNRRVASVVLLLVGAIASGWLMRSSGATASALFVAGGIKFVVAMAAFWALPGVKALPSVKA